MGKEESEQARRRKEGRDEEGRAGEGKEAEDRREPIVFPLKYSRCDKLLKALHKERILCM